MALFLFPSTANVTDRACIKRIPRRPYLFELLSAINSRLTDDDLAVAASVTRVASSRSPAVLSMVEAARSSKAIDAAAAPVAFFWGGGDMSQAFVAS